VVFEGVEGVGSVPVEHEGGEAEQGAEDLRCVRWLLEVVGCFECSCSAQHSSFSV